MQLLYEASQEGDARCLGIIPAAPSCSNAAPIGRCRTWAGIPSRYGVLARWLEGLADGDYAYFVHSYALA